MSTAIADRTANASLSPRLPRGRRIDSRRGSSGSPANPCRTERMRNERIRPDGMDDVYCMYAFICIMIAKTVARERILIVDPESGGRPVRMECRHPGAGTLPGSRACRFPEELARRGDQRAQSKLHGAASGPHAAVYHARKGRMDQRVLASSLPLAPRLSVPSGRPIAASYCLLRYRGNGVTLVGELGSGHGQYCDPSATTSPVDGWPLPRRYRQADAAPRNGDQGPVVAPLIDRAHPARLIDRLRPNGPAACAAGIDGSSLRCDPAWQPVWMLSPATSDHCCRPRLRTSRRAAQRGQQLRPRAAPAPADRRPPGRNAGTRPTVATTDRPEAVVIDRSNRFSGSASIANVKHIVIRNAALLRRSCAARIGRLRGHAGGYGASSCEMPGNSTLAAP